MAFDRFLFHDLIGAKAGGDDGNLDAVAHRFIEDGAEDDVGVFVRGVVNDGRSFVDFMQHEVAGAGDVDQDAARSIDGLIFQQRRRDGARGRFDGAFLSGRHAGSHHGHAHVLHDRPHVGEVAIDDSGNGDDVGDALHRLPQNIVGDAKGVEQAGAVLHALHQALVGNGDDRVDAIAQFLQPLLGLEHALLAFKLKRRGDDGHRQRFQFTAQRRDDGGGAGAGAASESGGHEDHVGAFERLQQFFRVLERRLSTNIRIRARAEPLGEFRPQLNFHRGARAAQRLQIGVGHQEIDAFDVGFDHAIDGVAAAAADADDFDLGVVPGGVLKS